MSRIRRSAYAFSEAITKREVAGLPTFGDYDPKTDHRLMSQETLEEVEDGGTYMRFFKRKWKDDAEAKRLATHVQKHLYHAWRLLLELREWEEQQTSGKGGAT